jgi:hypothetical protein
LRHLIQLLDNNVHVAEKYFDTANSSRIASALKLKARMENLIATSRPIEMEASLSAAFFCKMAIHKHPFPRALK